MTIDWSAVWLYTIADGPVRRSVRKGRLVTLLEGGKSCFFRFYRTKDDLVTIPYWERNSLQRDDIILSESASCFLVVIHSGSPRTVLVLQIHGFLCFRTRRLITCESHYCRLYANHLPSLRFIQSFSMVAYIERKKKKKKNEIGLRKKAFLLSKNIIRSNTVLRWPFPVFVLVLWCIATPASWPLGLHSIITLGSSKCQNRFDCH